MTDTFTITTGLDHGGLPLTVEVATNTDHTLTRMAAEEFLDACHNILYVDGTVVIRSNTSEVTLRTHGPHTVLLHDHTTRYGTLTITGAIRVEVNWEEGPTGARLRVTLPDVD
jgi:hypothetical protein